MPEKKILKIRNINQKVSKKYLDNYDKIFKKKTNDKHRTKKWKQLTQCQYSEKT